MTAGNVSVLQMAREVNKVARKGRYPIHTHLIEYRPYQIAPFFIAPVMAGETLKNLSLQARVISDPLQKGAGNILPWWCEHYFFYVKARQLVKAEFENMALNGVDLGITDAADAKTYHDGRGIDWVKRALTFIVEEGGFRNEGEAASVATLDGLPLAAAVRHATNWADSLMPDGAIAPNGEVGNHETPWEPRAEHLEAYERMRAMRLIDMDFEDYLKSMGVSLPEVATFEKPELIRYTANWAYPANTVDPATGLPSAAASFSVSERADKDRFFTEPGFIIGVTVARPKVFMANQKSTASVMLDNALAWMPRTMVDQPHITVQEFLGGASGTGPLRNQTAGYWVDTRDLFKYGDQFYSFATANGYAPALPTAAGEKRFVTGAMIDAMFVAPAANKFRQDGITRLSILGHPTTVVDNT